MDNPGDPRESCSRAYKHPPIQGGHCRKNQHFHGEDKHNPTAIASLRPVWKVFLDVIPRRVRPFGAEGGLTRIGWGWVGGWVGARPECDSQLKAGLLLAARKRGGKTGPSGVQGPPGHSEPH